MALLVLAFPKLNQSDFDWVQNHRKLHDKLYYDVVNPHFTIVFPIFSVNENDFTNEVLSKSEGINSFNFKIRSAVVNKDSFIDTYHEFLVPDKGFSSFIKLHDFLYSGLFSKELRLDIDFIPHVGIGNSVDYQICKQKVDILNESNIEISGIIDSLDTVKYEDNRVETLEKVQLL